MMGPVYLIDENNNNMTSANSGATGNISNNTKLLAPNCAQQVVMVSSSSVSSGSTSSLSSTSSSSSSNSSCCSTTSGNSSASGNGSLTSLHNHQNHHFKPSIQSSVSSSIVAIKTDEQQTAAVSTHINEAPANNKLNNQSINLPTTTTQAPKPRGRRKKIRTEPIRPICPQCEKQFSNQSALTKHKLTHSDERKFACQQCSKAFKRHDHLTGHMQTHSNRKPFNCTIHGCDKTYCDARSLRRHKENIHHIVTPKEMTGSNNNINNIQQQQHQQQQQGIKVEQMSCVTSSTTATPHTIDNNQQQPSHLLRRRIQRLHSDPGGQFSDEPARLLDTGTIIGHHDNHQHHHHYHSQTPQLNHHHQQNHHHLHHHQQAPFSADYASTQQFFDFNQMTPVEQQYCNGGSMPHSADSVYDSSLTLSSSVHYEPTTPTTTNATHPHNQQQPQHNNNSGYITPTTMHPQTPTMLAPQQQQSGQQYTPDEHQNYQQQQTNDILSPPVFSDSPTVPYQPSQLLRKRIQRLRSDPSGPFTPPAPLPDLTCRPSDFNRRTTDANNQHCHHASYSADYASTQHFTFDFNHQMSTTTTNTTNMDQQQNIQQHQQQQAPFSADYASMQQFFDFNQMTPVEQQYSDGGSMPQSADSIYDSSPTLSSIHYEPTTPNHTTTTAATHPHHIQPQQPQQQQQHNNSGYITPTTLHPPPTQTMLVPQQQSSQQYAQNEHQSYQQQQQQQTNDIHSPPVFNNNATVHHEPSQLLRKRIQRLRSDPGGAYEPPLPTAPLPDLTCRPIETHRRSVDTINQQCNQHHAPYSADYASTQHFIFDFNNQMASTTTTSMDQQ